MARETAKKMKMRRWLAALAVAGLIGGAVQADTVNFSVMLPSFTQMQIITTGPGNTSTFSATGGVAVDQSIGTLELTCNTVNYTIKAKGYYLTPDVLRRTSSPYQDILYTFNFDGVDKTLTTAFQTMETGSCDVGGGPITRPLRIKLNGAATLSKAPGLYTTQIRLLVVSP